MDSYCLFNCICFFQMRNEKYTYGTPYSNGICAYVYILTLPVCAMVTSEYKH